MQTQRLTRNKHSGPSSVGAQKSHLLSTLGPFHTKNANAEHFNGVIPAHAESERYLLCRRSPRAPPGASPKSENSQLGAEGCKTSSRDVNHRYIRHLSDSLQKFRRISSANSCRKGRTKLDERPPSSRVLQTTQLITRGRYASVYTTIGLP